MSGALRLIGSLVGLALLLAAAAASFGERPAPAVAQEQDDADATATLMAVLDEVAALQTQVAVLQTQVADQAPETPTPTPTPQMPSPTPTEPEVTMAEPVDCGEPVTGWGSAAIGELRLNLVAVDREPAIDATPPADASWVEFDITAENLGGNPVTVDPRQYTLLACDGSILGPADFSDIGGIGFQAGEIAPMAEVTGSLGFAVPTGVEPALLFYRIEGEDGCRGEFRFPLATGEPGESKLMTQVLVDAGLEECGPTVEGGTSTGGRDGGDGGDATGGNAVGGDGGAGGDAVSGDAIGGDGCDGADAVGGDGGDASGGDGGDGGAASTSDCPPR